jgi:hypothetical protein
VNTFTREDLALIFSLLRKEAEREGYDRLIEEKVPAYKWPRRARNLRRLVRKIRLAQEVQREEHPYGSKVYRRG